MAKKLIGYSNSHMKYAYGQLISSVIIFNKTLFNKKISKVQSSHFRNISTDTLGNGRGACGGANTGTTDTKH